MKLIISCFACMLALSCLTAFAAPTLDDIQGIKSRFSSENLPHASVEIGGDGRVNLTGQYKDRAEVQLAFALAQQVVGVRWVAPTTPENVRYPGTENMRALILAALRKSKQKPVTTNAPGENYALVVGVGHYANQRIKIIENAGNDAKLFYQYLETKNFRGNNLTLLLEKDATKQNVSREMRNLENKVQPNDTVVLYFSTHGAPPNDLGNMPIVLYDTRVNPERSWFDPQTAILDDDIKQFVEAVSPARVMVVLDVCYSGEAFVRIPGFIASTSKDLFVEESSFATGVSQKNLDYLAGDKQEQKKILIAASGPNEKSWDSSSLKQSYFTYYFVDQLKRKGDVQEAFMAAKPIVQSEVRRIVSVEQNKEVNQTPQGTFIPESADLKF